MSDYTLHIPEEIYRRAEQIAGETSQPVDRVLIEHLRTLETKPSGLLPSDAAELEALKALSDDTLWTIAREQMPADVQSRAHELMDKNSRGSITDAEHAELNTLAERADRLMLRKAEAAFLLRTRGHAFAAKDFKPDDE
jgi:hypothetical protein